MNKLPVSWKIQWAQSRNREEKPNLQDISEWLKERSSLINAVHDFPMQQKNEKKEVFKDNWKYKSKREDLLTTVEGQVRVCILCKEDDHLIPDCKEFVKLSVKDRRKKVQDFGLCYSCLKQGHRAFKCRRRRKCGLEGCGSFHNRKLHTQNSTNFEKEKPLCFQQEKRSGEHQTVGHTTMNKNRILLKVLPVIVSGPINTVQTYALMDEGSTVSLIQEELANSIGLDGPREKLRLRWMNDSGLQEIMSRKVAFDIQGKGNPEKYHLQNVRTVGSLNLNPQSLNLVKMRQRWSHLMSNAEYRIDDYVNAKPLILLGQDNWELIVSRRLIQGPKNSPALSLTNLGWVMHGRINTRNTGEFEENVMCMTDGDDVLHKMVKESFSIDNFGVVTRKSDLTREEERAISIMERTAHKQEDRWVIGLPWKEEAPIIPESFEVAYRRLLIIEKKMSKSEQYFEEYCNKIKEYEEKKYARKLNPDEIETDTKVWYLPYFGVVNPNKPGKFRFVFDAAAKSQGKSLNDLLLKGPDLMADLIGTLFNFRQKEIAFSADIKEMFHQVRIREKDQHAQRFLWRNGDTEEKAGCYVMKRMIFGAVSSPFCAQYVKNRNAEDYKHVYPRAFQAITKFHYVDDYLDSTHTVEEAKNLISEVRTIHESGGFLLRGWLSNSKEMLSHIPEDLVATSKELSEPSDNNVKNERVLGIMWNTEEDVLAYSTKFHKVKADLLEGKCWPSKRELLKIVMSIYDPLGLVSNFVIKGRILLQEIWRKQVDWDDTIDKDDQQRWLQWLRYLQLVRVIKIPRVYCKEMRNVVDRQLHVFCDASEQAYAAVAYIRCTTEERIYVSLTCAKARVMPLKGLTIPKAELQAAILGMRMANLIVRQHTINFDKILFWIDAQIVLNWIRSSNKKHPSFIANRIGEILESTNLDQWHWIQSEENVADEATRFETHLDYSENSRWLHGPSFLKLEESKWPKEVKHNDNDAILN